MAEKLTYSGQPEPEQKHNAKVEKEQQQQVRDQINADPEADLHSVQGTAESDGSDDLAVRQRKD